ncbi:Linear gramicidin synthase subunit B [Rhodococcus sp. T7]|nr:Linear gramicidin synthase subunit B [Rhodococcus sp. T7]
MFERKTVAGLAEVAVLTEDAVAVAVALEELPGGGVGRIPLTPIMRWFLEGGGGFNRFSQFVPVTLPAGIDDQVLVRTLQAVVDHHDVLRSRMSLDDTGTWNFETQPVGAVDVDELLHCIRVDSAVQEADLTALASSELDAALSRLDPAAGKMIRFVRFDFENASSDERRPGVLLIVAQHFAVDGVSWRILISDLAVAWSQITAGDEPALPVVGTSMRLWANRLVDEAHSADRTSELALWRGIVGAGDEPLFGTRKLDPVLDVEPTVERVEVTLSGAVTDAILTTVPARFHGGVNDGLLAALAMAIAQWRRVRGIARTSSLVRLEGHGREDEVVPGADLSRTVGWFTSTFPVRLDVDAIDLDDAFAGGAAAGEVVKAVKEQLLTIPDKGMGYGLLRYLNDDTGLALAGSDTGEVCFNYLGRVSARDVPEGLAEFGWAPTGELGGITAALDADMPARATIEINSIVTDGPDGPRLGAGFAYASNVITRVEVQEFADLWTSALVALSDHVKRPDAGGLTPSDLSLVATRQRDLDLWQTKYPSITDVWPLSPLQSGLFFHSMMTQSSVDVYTIQTVLELSGVVDADRLRRAAEAVVDRHATLRTAFVSDSSGKTIQIVVDHADLPWREIDLTSIADAESRAEAQRAFMEDQTTQFDMARPPMMRFTLVRVAHNRWSFGVTTHHILLDGWSTPLLMQDLLVLYAVNGDKSVLPRVRSFRSFLEWLSRRDERKSLDTWAEALAGITEPTMMASSIGGVDNTGTGIDKVAIELSGEKTAQLTALAAKEGVTVNTLVQAAWAILLGRMTGRSDVVFGATVSGRPADLAGVETMVGLFINTVPVRVRVDERETVSGLLRRLQGQQADLLDHHYVGLTEISQAAGVGALFDTLLVFESYPIDRQALGAASSVDGLQVTGVAVQDATHYPLTLLVSMESRLDLTFKYQLDSFERSQVETLSVRFTRVLESFVSRSDAVVDEIEILSREELDEILQDSRGVGSTDDAALSASEISATAMPSETLAQLLADVVEDDPDAPALVVEGDQISYAELDRRSSQLARVLIGRGVGPGSYVPVVGARSAESVLAMWAVIKSGAAFAPVDPSAPMALGFDEGDCSIARIGVTVTSHRAALTDAIDWLCVDDSDVVTLAAAEPAHPVTYVDRVKPLLAEHPAYVLYRSALANGRERVVVPQQGLAAFLAVARERLSVTYESRTLLIGQTGSDPWVLEFLVAATAGAAMVFARDSENTGEGLAQLLADEWVTHAFVPSTALTGVDSDGVNDLETLVLLDGLAPTWLIDRWSAGGTALFDGSDPSVVSAAPTLSSRDVR